MQKRTAPPFSSYLWYFLWQPKALRDRTSDIIASGRDGQLYHIVKTVPVAWMYFTIVFSGFLAFSFGSSWIYGSLAAFIGFLLADLICGLYSYRHTEFEELSGCEERELQHPLPLASLEKEASPCRNGPRPRFRVTYGTLSGSQCRFLIKNRALSSVKGRMSRTGW